MNKPVPCPHCGADLFIVKRGDAQPGRTAPSLGSFRKRFTLTPRESEVADLICEGLSNKEVAKRLGITEQVAKNFLGEAYRKIGVHCRAHLILVAIGTLNPRKNPPVKP